MVVTIKQLSTIEWTPVRADTHDDGCRTAGSATPVGVGVRLESSGSCRWLNCLACYRGFFAYASTHGDLTVRALFGHQRVYARRIMCFPPGDRWVEHARHA